MNRIRNIITLGLCVWSQMCFGGMKEWKTHFSFNTISAIEDAGEYIYCISDGELMEVDMQTEEAVTLSKLTGLNGSDAALLRYNPDTRKTLIVYRNGMIDIVDSEGDVTNMPDVFMKTEVTPAEFFSATSHKDRVYLCSSIGIININLKKNEVAETYVLQSNDENIMVQAVCVLRDSIYAATETGLYAASLRDNLIDYAAWQPVSLPFASSIVKLGSKGEFMYLYTTDGLLYCFHDGAWQRLLTDQTMVDLHVHTASVIAYTKSGAYDLDGVSSTHQLLPHVPIDVMRKDNYFWLSAQEQGLLKWSPSEGTQQYEMNSPYVNYSYRLRTMNDKLIMLPGGYWAGFYARPGTVMMYENGMWSNYTYHDILAATGEVYYDFADAAIDPQDPSHFFVASFGYGLLEFRNNVLYAHYTPDNSAIEPTSPGRKYPYYWVDGLTQDKEGNLWMTNVSLSGVKVLKKDGTWLAFENNATRDLNRTKDLLIWNKNPNIKLITCGRVIPGIGVFDDNGTLANQSDDKAVFIGSFKDQNEKEVTPNFVYSICQMASGEIWIGTERGIIVISDVSKLLKGDYHCRRIIIPRNDGSGLGDYLLGDEQINAIVEDASGRKWIGTETSGLYLVSSDGLETIEHFTKANSPLVSDAIYSLAILSRTGEVFIGTSIGLLSYQSDANAAKADMSAAYAYPNPVPPHYTGYISITGLMDNSAVNIIDAGGNLVCRTRSNGGLAVWDGKDGYGRRVTPGIYTALCNAEGGHTAIKILIVR